ITSDFINAGKFVISGGSFVINGTFDVKSTGIANINNSYFQNGNLIVEGKYNAFNSSIFESNQRIATNAEYAVIQSERSGGAITWEVGAKVTVKDSNIRGSMFEDLDAAIVTNNAYFKMECVFRNGQWKVENVLI